MVKDLDFYGVSYTPDGRLLRDTSLEKMFLLYRRQI